MVNAFKYALYHVNHQRSLLRNINLIYDIQNLPTTHRFEASKKGKHILRSISIYNVIRICSPLMLEDKNISMCTNKLIKRFNPRYLKFKTCIFRLVMFALVSVAYGYRTSWLELRLGLTFNKPSHVRSNLFSEHAEESLFPLSMLYLMSIMLDLLYLDIH